MRVAGGQGLMRSGRFVTMSVHMSPWEPWTSSRCSATQMVGREGPVAVQHVVVAARDGDGDALEHVLLPPLRRPPVAAVLLLLLLPLVVLLREDRHDRLAPAAEGREGGGEEVVAQSRALGTVLVDLVLLEVVGGVMGVGDSSSASSVRRHADGRVEAEGLDAQRGVAAQRVDALLGVERGLDLGLVPVPAHALEEGLEDVAQDAVVPS